MTIASSWVALSDRFRGMASGVEILDALEGEFRSIGATHFIMTGLPLPGRPIDTLVLRLRWGELRSDRAASLSIRPEDALLEFALRARRPFVREQASNNPIPGESLLLAELGPDAAVLGVPICAFLPYQGVVVAGGPSFSLEHRVLLGIEHASVEAFRRLFQLGYVRPERPGELSARERRVLELSALGKTANQIATILEISQRTVHAHLQNASEKLRANNKTHTVVEALRYGQISI